MVLLSGVPLHWAWFSPSLKKKKEVFLDKVATECFLCLLEHEATVTYTPFCSAVHSLFLVCAPQKSKEPVQSASVFSTAVDEDTIQAARQRSQNIFTTDDWSEVKTGTVSLVEIISSRAYEQ